MFHGELETRGMLIVIEPRTLENKGVFKVRCNNRSNECEKMWNLLAFCLVQSIASRLAAPQMEGRHAWGAGGAGGSCATGGKL